MFISIVIILVLLDLAGVSLFIQATNFLDDNPLMFAVLLVGELYVIFFMTESALNMFE